MNHAAGIVFRLMAALLCCGALIPLLLVCGAGVAELLQPVLPEGFPARKSARYAAFLLLLLAWPLLEPAWRSRLGMTAGWTRQLARGILLGLGIALLLEAVLLLLGLHVPGTRGAFSWSHLLQQVFKGVATGIGVALLEETVFRGALFGGLQRAFGTAAAVLAGSLFFAVLHFPDYRFLDADAPFWERGLAVLPALAELAIKPQWMDAGAALFVLGALLAVMRLHDGNLWRCIGLHCAIVAGVRPVRYLTDPAHGEWAFLVSSHRPPLGVLAFILFTAVLIWQLRRQRTSA